MTLEEIEKAAELESFKEDVWYEAIPSLMLLDGFDDAPVMGEYYVTAYPKILRYILALRNERG